MPIDETDFVDRDYQIARSATPSATGPVALGGSATARRAPTREELDSQLTATQQQLAKLREAQDQLERARAAVEELRRRRAEYQSGRDEMMQQLTRSIGILEKVELDARREADQAGRSLEGLRAGLQNVGGLNEQAWTDENWDAELNKALVTLENARMELNSARLRWPILEGKTEEPRTAPAASSTNPGASLENASFLQLCRMGFALTWPLALVVLAAGAGLVALLLRR